MNAARATIMLIVAMLLIAAVALLLMSGCGPLLRIKPAAPDPYNVHTDPICYQQCTEPALPIGIDPHSARHSLEIEHALRHACEVRRQACADALQRARDAHAVQ